MYTATKNDQSKARVKLAMQISLDRICPSLMTYLFNERNNLLMDYFVNLVVLDYGQGVESIKIV